MPKIFISYRRADSRTFTDRIYDRLITTFQQDNVFQDVDNIPVGADFRKVLRQEIDKCDIVLVVIGSQWITVTDEKGRKRLDSAADYVRFEVEYALKNDKYVIPVLIEGASMPDISELPQALEDLVFRNAATIRHNPDFHRDMERLIKAIKEYESLSHAVHGGIDAIAAHSDVATLIENESLEIIPDLSAYNTAILKILPPPFEWCFVPSGHVTLKTKPPESYPVADFLIAKYPITNAQFELFVTDRDGYMYENDYGWFEFSAESRRYRGQNPKPKTTGFRGDNFPRTNISWFDAIAFCQWLSHRVGQTISLPTEQQWQLAAIGDKEWAYPWGNQFDSTRCNTLESAIGHPVNVTEYPRGASPFNVFQMCGNVYDWCLNNYDEPNDTELSSVVTKRVVRGGSWNNPHNSTTRAYHRWHANPTRNLNDNVGFRIVLTEP